MKQSFYIARKEKKCQKKKRKRPNSYQMFLRI